jgi:hypothetical protein
LSSHQKDDELSAHAGIVALVLRLIFNVDERLSNVLSPRPLMVGLQIAGDPVFKIEVNRTTGKNTAELFVDLINKNDKLVATQHAIRRAQAPSRSVGSWTAIFDFSGSFGY